MIYDAVLGEKEALLMPVEHSHIINEIMDEIRRQVGVVYKEDSRWCF